MSIDPGTMQQMLAQRLMQGPQTATAGGGAAGPQMQGKIGATGAASDLLQKIMLMKAMQNAPQTPGGATGRQQAQANGMLPGTNAQMAADPQMQALQQAQMQQMQLGQPAIPGQMPPGSS